MKKLYFYRLYDQWKGIDIAVEDEINELCFLIQIPDLDDIDRLDEGVAELKANFDDGNLGEAKGEVFDKKRRIIKLTNIPPEILATNGLYKVTFTLTTKRGEETVIEKTATQTFSILEAVELSEDYIKNYDRYDEITQLLEKFYEEKVIDLTMYAKTEDVERLIEEALNGVDMETIIAELEAKGLYVTPEQLINEFNIRLSEYVTKFDSAQFATMNELKKYTKTTDLSNTLGLNNYAKKTELSKYVEKESDKTLTSNDFTDELKSKLENIPEDGHYDDTELRDLINKKASHDYVDERIKSLNSISKEDYYDKTIIDQYVNTHNKDISDLEKNIINVETSIEESFLKKEDYQYLDGINTDDVTLNEKTLTEILAELFYKEIEIKNFNTTLISHLYEYRVDKITSITLKWELNKNPISQNINIYNGELSVEDRQITMPINIDTDTDIILTIVDENGVEKNATITLKFVHPSYYGVYENNLTNNDIRNNNKIIMDNKNKTINMSYVNSKIFFAYPKTFGELIDIKDNNGLSYFNDFIYNGMDYAIGGVSYNVYMLDERATVKSISYSLIFEKEEE